MSAWAGSAAFAADKLEEAMQQARAVWRDDVAKMFVIKHHGPVHATLKELIQSAQKLERALSRAELLLQVQPIMLVYMQATPAYIQAYGEPVVFYTDKHRVLRVDAASARRGDGMSQ